MEEVLGADEEEGTPEQEAAPAPVTPLPKRGRPAAPKTPPITKAGFFPCTLHIHSLRTSALCEWMHLQR